MRPWCGGTLAKLGETITETLESIPPQIQCDPDGGEILLPFVRDDLTGGLHRSPDRRGRAGPDLLATVMHAKFGEHQPLNRQSERFAAEGIELSVTTLADWVAPARVLSPPGHVRSGLR